MRPLITALIDTYNHEAYIEQALASVIEQGLSPAELEIIVVDDGSTDNAPSVIQKFVPRAKHLRKRNGGQASAFNAGVAESHGEFIAFLDGDDWWVKGKLAAVADALEKNPQVAAAGHGHYEFDEQTKQERARVPRATMFVDLATPSAAEMSWPFLLMGALTVRRALLDWIMPIPQELFMADAAIQLAAMTRGAVLLDQPLFYYRRHAENSWLIDETNATKLRLRCERVELMFRRTRQMLIELGVPEAAVCQLLRGPWADAKRTRLSRFGGTRREALQAEMEAFHAACPNPSIGYSLFKHLFVGTATLAMPPQHFYKLRNWYASSNVSRIRERLWTAEKKNANTIENVAR